MAVEDFIAKLFGRHFNVRGGRRMKDSSWAKDKKAKTIDDI